MAFCPTDGLEASVPKTKAVDVSVAYVEDVTRADRKVPSSIAQRSSDRLLPGEIPEATAVVRMED
jgi:hypothetical protein